FPSLWDAGYTVAQQKQLFRSEIDIRRGWGLTRRKNRPRFRGNRWRVCLWSVPLACAPGWVATKRFGEVDWVIRLQAIRSWVILQARLPNFFEARLPRVLGQVANSLVVTRQYPQMAYDKSRGEFATLPGYLKNGEW